MRDGLAVHTAEGALGGMLGTLLIKQTMALSRKIPVKAQPPTPSRDSADVVVERIEDMRGRAFSERGYQALRWAYGISWGGLLGLAIGGLHVRSARKTLLAGAGMGALVWAVGNGLSRSGRRQSAGRVITSLLMHVGCGVAASVPILIIDRVREQRQPWWQRLATRASEPFGPFAL